MCYVEAFVNTFWANVSWHINTCSVNKWVLVLVEGEVLQLWDKIVAIF